MTSHEATVSRHAPACRLFCVPVGTLHPKGIKIARWSACNGVQNQTHRRKENTNAIVSLLCEIAGQLYKETNAKAQIAAQIARKRASLMKLQDAFNAAYFSELIDAVSLHVGGGVVLHTKTETDICESEEEPNGSPENSETDSFRN